MSIKQIKSMVTFTRGTAVTWEALVTPVPDGVVAFSIDDGGFRLGDGVTLYKNLPILFDYDTLVSTQGGLSDLFIEPTSAQNGNIVVVSFDSGTNTVRYAVSNTTLSSLLASIAQLETDNTNQDTAIAELLARALSIDASINTAGDNTVVIINDKRYSSSGQTLSSIQAYIASEADYVPGSHLDEPVFYTSATKAKTVNKLKLYDNCTYFVDIVGFNNNIENAVYGLSAANPNITITNISGSFFSFTLNNVTNVSKTDTPVVLVASIDDGTGNRLVKKALACLVASNRILATVFGGSADIELYTGVTCDQDNNIYAFGYAKSSTYGLRDALIVKFDSNLNILANKQLGGAGSDQFVHAVVNNNNVFVVGYTDSDTAGSVDGLIVKFDKDLNILAKKRYGGGGSDYFYGVAVDSNNNIFVVAHSISEGLGNWEALILKLDQNLNIILRKRYGTTGEDRFAHLAINANNDIYAVGWTGSEGAGGYDALIVKFDNNLRVLASKRYGGIKDEEFFSVAVGPSGNVYTCGWGNSESNNLHDGLIVKFDKDLNVLVKKHFGGDLGVEQFYCIAVDSSERVCVSGYTSSETYGSWDAMFVKFDSNLNIITKKRFGSISAEAFFGMTCDSNDNAILVGDTSGDGAGSYDALVVKLPENVPSGTFVGTVLAALTLTDITTLTLSDSNLTYGDISTFTLADSNLTYADITTLSFSTTNYVQEKDVLN